MYPFHMLLVRWHSLVHYVVIAILLFFNACDNSQYDIVPKKSSKTVDSRHEASTKDFEKYYPIIIQSATGKIVTIPHYPKRILVILPLYLEILSDLQALDRVVGTTSNNVSEASAICLIGTSVQPNLEVAFSLQPDLVLGLWDATQCQTFEDAGIPVMLVGNLPYGNINTVEELFQVIETVAYIIEGTKDKGKTLVGTMRKEISILQQRTKKNAPSAMVMYVLPNQAPYVQGRQTLEHDILEKSGFTNVFADIIGSQQISSEQVILRNPEYIFSDPTYVRDIQSDVRWSFISAIANTKVIGIPTTQWSSSKVSKTFEILTQLLQK